MKKLTLSPSLEEKIYDLKFDSNEDLQKITTYFPLNSKEKQAIFKFIRKTDESSLVFKSIFLDKISEPEWNKSKDQIKKKFHDELFEID